MYSINMKKKKIFVTAASGVLLVLLYCVIFNFSAQDGKESGSLSQKISEKCVEIVNTISGKNWSSDVRACLAEFWEHPIRKLAHFSEYACMGLLVFTLWSQWMRRGRRLYLLTVVWVFLSALFDELHQRYVPGRYCSFADVLLDTCGGVFGMLFCLAVWKLCAVSARGKGAG